MGKVFEEEFMDVLMGLLDMCEEALEVSRKRADKIFMHGVIGVASSFDSFYERKKRIVPSYEMFPSQLDINLAVTGTQEMLKLLKVCKKHDRPCPQEFKMVYHVMTGKLETDFNYDAPLPEDTEMVIGDLYDAWLEEEQKKLAAR